MSFDLNSITATIYSTGTTRLVIDWTGQIGGIKFSTGFPGGLSLEGEFAISRQLLRQLAIKGGERVVFYNKITPVYEGWIDFIDSISDEDSEGIAVGITGGWGRYMTRRFWNKPWADKRIDDNIWKWLLDVNDYLFDPDRSDRLMAMPKDGVVYANGDQCGWQYTTPTGETIKRITFDYGFAEGAQNWDVLLYDMDHSSVEWIISATGTGTVNRTIATPTARLRFIFRSLAAQTGIGNGTVFGRFSNITVYTELGSINLTEISKDIRAKISEFNSSDVFVYTNTYDLTPFVSDGYESLADIITRAADFGDASYYHWAAQLLVSDLAPVPNGGPLLSVLQYPLLTDYDYKISVGAENIAAPFVITRDYSQIVNWVIITWEDELGKEHTTTPDDDATFKDTTSISTHGQRDITLNLKNCTNTEAANAGRRYLAEFKDPRWTLDDSIIVKGYIHTKYGGIVPSSEIKAGKRIRVEDYSGDLTGAGVIFLISHTDYDDEEGICSIQSGPPPDLTYAYAPFHIFAPNDPKGPARKKRRKRRKRKPPPK